MRGVMVVQTKRLTRTEAHRQKFWYERSLQSKLEHLYKCERCRRWRVQEATK